MLRQFVEPSDSRLWRVLGLLRRGVPRRRSARRPGISAWFLAEMGRNVGLEADVRAAGARLVDPDDADGAPRCSRRPSGPGFADRELAGLAGTTARRLRAARLALGLVPGYAMVDTCAAEFAAETPYFYSTYAAAGSPPEAPPVARRPRSSSAAGRSGSGRGSSSTTAPCRPPTRSAAPAGGR